ncbi:pilus assembly protein [bacterium]|nr:MAG: pilus assembly protein [bacterium]
MINVTKKSHRTARRRSGQTIVETAFMLAGVLIPTTIGMMQFAIILNATNTLTQIAREGGRYAAVHGTEAGADDAIRDYIQSVAKGTSIKPTDLPDANITIAMAPLTSTSTVIPARVSGNPIRVTIKFAMSKRVFVPNLPFLGNLKNDYFATSTFVLE